MVDVDSQLHRVIIYSIIHCEYTVETTLHLYCTRDLKGHCQEDFAVLGQFCAKIITLRL